MEKTMNIHAQEGDKVIFAYPDNGWEWQKEHALKYLTINTEYTIDFTDVHSSSTDIYLKEFPEVKFNSVQFRDK